MAKALPMPVLWIDLTGAFMLRWRFNKRYNKRAVSTMQKRFYYIILWNFFSIFDYPLHQELVLEPVGINAPHTPQAGTLNGLGPGYSRAAFSARRPGTSDIFGNRPQEFKQLFKA
jgi:hypothetical protein